MALSDAQKFTLINAILNRNPYAVMTNAGLDPNIELPDGWQMAIEEDAYEGLEWNFKTLTHRIRKAIRIKITYKDKNGNAVMEHLLLGFGGSAGF